MLHHPNLYLTDSNTVAGIGVKSSVTHRRGDFIGFYSGSLMHKDLYKNASHETQQISFEISGTDYLVVRKDENDVIGFVNEVPALCTANVTAIPLHLDAGNAVGYFASKTIRPHTELWVFYGDSYSRSYRTGHRLTDPSRLQRVESVISNQALSDLHRYCATRALVKKKK